MNRYIISFWITFIIVNYTNASFKGELFETITRVGEEARQTNAANLRRTIQETKRTGSNPDQWSCVDSKIGASYQELHTSLNKVLDDLRSKLRNNDPVFMSIPLEKGKNLIEQSVGEVTAAANARLSQIRNCVPQ